jgi:hypothetical protein
MKAGMRKKVRGLVFLCLLIFVSVGVVVCLLWLQASFKWQHVRLLTPEERERVDAAYGPYGYTYRYVVIKEVKASDSPRAWKALCGREVTVPVGRLSDGITFRLGIDAYGEAEWLLHDTLYQVQRADDGSCVTRAAADNTLSLAGRRIATQLYGASYWEEDGKVGAQSLPPPS